MKPYCCPVCNGRGTVPSGFYQTSKSYSVSESSNEMCKSCKGTGVLWSEDEKLNSNDVKEIIVKCQPKTLKKHFEFTDKTKTLSIGTVLHQIKAIKDLPMHNIKKGDVGGWIEKPENLSENAWVSGDAQVSGNAKVSGDAWVSGNAKIAGNARVFGKAWISGYARVSGNAKVSGNAWLYGNTHIFGNTQVSGNAKVSGDV